MDAWCIALCVVCLVGIGAVLLVSSVEVLQRDERIAELLQQLESHQKALDEQAADIETARRCINSMRGNLDVMEEIVDEWPVRERERGL